MFRHFTFGHNSFIDVISFEGRVWCRGHRSSGYLVLELSRCGSLLSLRRGWEGDDNLFLVFSQGLVLKGWIYFWIAVTEGGFQFQLKLWLNGKEDNCSWSRLCARGASFLVVTNSRCACAWWDWYVNIVAWAKWNSATSVWTSIVSSGFGLHDAFSRS